MAVYSLKYIYIVLKVYMLVGSLQQINIAPLTQCSMRVFVCVYPIRDIELLHANVEIAIHTYTYIHIYCIYIIQLKSGELRFSSFRISFFHFLVSLSLI